MGFLGYDPRPVPDGLGQVLFHLRQGRGQSQADLAAELGIDPGTLARWERMAAQPTGNLLNRVRQQLGM